MDTTVTAGDGTPLALSTTGAGAPVVFVHGSNGGLDSWTDIGGRLQGYRVVRYARRNHPPSGVGPAPNNFAVEAQDLLTVLESVGRAHVVGGSYGAMVALHTALAGADPTSKPTHHHSDRAPGRAHSVSAPNSACRLRRAASSHIRRPSGVRYSAGADSSDPMTRTRPALNSASETCRYSARTLTLLVR